MVTELRLLVVSSTIEGKGIVKIDPSSFEKLKLSEGTKILVKYGTKSHEMVARQDPIYGESTARLMNLDMEGLRVRPGSKVIVCKKSGPSQRDSRISGAKVKKGKSKRGAKNAASLDSF